MLLLVLGCSKPAPAPTSNVASSAHGAKPAAPSATGVDWELAIEQTQQMRETVAAEERTAGAKRSSDEAQRYNEWLAGRFPNTALAARVEADAVDALFAEQKYEAAAAGVLRVIERYPAFPRVHDRLLESASRLVKNEQVAPELRLAALRTIAPVLKQRARLVEKLARTLEKMTIAPGERLAITRALADSCGGHPACREALPKARTGARDAGSPSALSAPLAAASSAAPASTQAFTEASRLLAEGDSSAAARALERDPQAFTERSEPMWRSLLRGLPALDPRLALPILRLYAERGPEGPSRDLAVTALRRINAVARDTVPILVALASRGDDRGENGELLDRAVRWARHDGSQAPLLLDTLKTAAAVAERLGLADRRVEYLFEIGKITWDSAPDTARAALRDAAEFYPVIPEAAQAGFMLGVLEGRIPIEQPPTPRPRLASDARPLAPALALPPTPDVSRPFVVTPLGVMLAQHNPNEDLVRGRKPSASHDAKGARLAFDGDPITSWRPEALPASLIVPLAREATVERLKLKARGRLYFTVSFVDRSGKVLTRLERDWGFWESYRREDYWPDPEQNLEFAPVPRVSFVRLDVYESLGAEVGVDGLELYSSSYDAEALHLASPIALGAARSVRVDYAIDEPRRTVSYDASAEWARIFPVTRWRNFWTRPSGPLRLASSGNLALSFFGTNATVVLDKAGPARFQIDAAAPALIERTETKKSEHVLASDLAPGEHVLKLGQPSREEDPGTARFLRLDVNGAARARVAVRFGRKSAWSAWSPPLGASGQTLAVPAKVSGAAPELVQAGAFFDTREVRGLETPRLAQVAVAPLAEPARQAPVYQRPAEPLARDDLASAVKLLSERGVVVAYPKSGTAAEHDVARRIAEKAGVYLASDDLGLNWAKGPVLAVGTPHRNRYARQLLALRALWSSPGFFADTDGLVSVERDLSGGVMFLAVTGETPEAVVRAGERLLAALPERAPVKASLRVFPANPLTQIPAWDLAARAPALKSIDLRLAGAERRSAVFGVSADAPIERLRFEVTEPVNQRGTKLEKPLLRPVGYYEWVPFFGDLRVPNLLLDTSTVSMPKNTTRGVWVTAATPEQAEPGAYRAELSIDADGTVTRVPLTIRVEPFSLPARAKTASTSFTTVPHWYRPGGPGYEAVLRKLAADEAAHRVTHVTPALLLDWQVEASSVPARLALGPPPSVPAKLSWTRRSDWNVSVPAGQALFGEFSASGLRSLLSVARTAQDSKLLLDVWVGQAWRSVESLPATPSKTPVAYVFPLPKGTYRYFRLSVRDGAAFSISQLAGFEARAPIRFDFSALDHGFDVYEEEYSKVGFLPSFVVQTSPYLDAAARDLSGIEHVFEGGVATLFGAQFRDYLAREHRLERTLIRVADEPKDLDRWVEIARALGSSGVATMTCHNGDLPDLADAVGVMNPWCPNYQSAVQKPFFTERRAAGDKVWWYAYGPPNLRLTGRPVDNLAFHWLTARWRFDGAMSYAALDARSNGLMVPFRYDAGQWHRVLLLPDGRLLDSPRRELEGEGISDVRLIERVRSALGRVRSPSDAKAIADRVDAILDGLVRSRYDYPEEPEPWIAARNELYDLTLRALKPN